MSLHQTDIGTIETLQWGEGRERILLLHCAGSGPHSLTTLAKSLCSAERMVIVPALNRYGHTDVNPTDAIKEHVSVVNWVLNHYAQEADSVSLFGHSMGGLIALLVIAQTQTRCDHVVVYDPIVPNVLDGADQRDCDALAWDRDIVMTLHDAVANGDYERGVSRFIEAWNATPWRKLPESVRSELIRTAPRLAREIYAISHHDPQGLDRYRWHPVNRRQTERSATRANRCQVTLLTGEASPTVAGRMVARLAERYVHATRNAIAGADHMYPVKHGAEMAKEIDHLFKSSLANAR